MVSHRDRRTTKSVTRTPLRPMGYGGIGPSAALPLLDRWRTSTSSWRLAYGPMALVTRSLQGSTTGCHRRDRIAGTIQSLEEVIQRIEDGLTQPPDRVEIPPERRLGCTQELRAAGLDSMAKFLVVVSPDGAIDRIMRVESGRAVPDSLNPELEDAIKTVAASQFEPSLLNGEGITAVYEVTFDCSG